MATATCSVLFPKFLPFLFQRIFLSLPDKKLELRQDARASWSQCPWELVR